MILKLKRKNIHIQKNFKACFRIKYVSYREFEFNKYLTVYYTFNMEIYFFIIIYIQNNRNWFTQVQSRFSKWHVMQVRQRCVK